jgi:hypothetical protein
MDPTKQETDDVFKVLKSQKANKVSFLSLTRRWPVPAFQPSELTTSLSLSYLWASASFPACSLQCTATCRSLPPSLAHDLRYRLKCGPRNIAEHLFLHLMYHLCHALPLVIAVNFRDAGST